MDACPSNPNQTKSGQAARNSIVIALLVAAGPSPAAAPRPPDLLASPDGRIQVSIQMPPPGSAERPRWSARFGPKPLLTQCGLGLATADAGDLMPGARVLHQEEAQS